MNERTHFFTKIYLSHFILERVDVYVECERWVETGSSLDHSSTSSTSWLGLLNQGSLRATGICLQADSHSGIPVPYKLNGRRHLPLFFHNAHLLPLLLPLIYTGASLIDGPVKGQYITRSHQKHTKNKQDSKKKVVPIYKNTSKH